MFILLKFSALQSDLDPADAVAKGIDENWRKDYGISTSSQLDSTYLDDFCKTHGFAKWCVVVWGVRL